MLIFLIVNYELRFCSVVGNLPFVAFFVPFVGKTGRIPEICF